MLAETLTFLRTWLDQALHQRLGGDDAAADLIVLPSGDKSDPITFQLNAVTMLLVTVEEERLLRPPDRYVRRDEGGVARRIQPDIRLSLRLLFVARFKRYEAAWQHLSAILQHLQSHPALDSDAPGAPRGLDHLTLELLSLSLSEQNELWGALRAGHQPSLVYRVQLLAYHDRDPSDLPKVVEAAHQLHRLP